MAQLHVGQVFRDRQGVRWNLVDMEPICLRTDQDLLGRYVEMRPCWIVLQALLQTGDLVLVRNPLKED